MFVEQSLADAWAREAQRFVGFWHGRPVHGAQLKPNVTVDDEAWTEPLDETDSCQFCPGMTEERVDARIAGFQHEMDCELVRINYWVNAALAEEGLGPLDKDKPAQYHQLVMLAQSRWPAQFDPLGYDFTILPGYLKWRLCVRWNHLLRDWLAAHPDYVYDAEQRLPVLKETRTPFQNPPPAHIGYWGL